MRKKLLLISIIAILGICSLVYYAHGGLDTVAVTAQKLVGSEKLTSTHPADGNPSTVSMKCDDSELNPFSSQKISCDGNSMSGKNNIDSAIGISSPTGTMLVNGRDAVKAVAELSYDIQKVNYEFGDMLNYCLSKDQKDISTAEACAFVLGNRGMYHSQLRRAHALGDQEAGKLLETDMLRVKLSLL